MVRNDHYYCLVLQQIDQPPTFSLPLHDRNPQGRCDEIWQESVVTYCLVDEPEIGQAMQSEMV